MTWVGLGVAVSVPVVLAAMSPFLAYRNLPYIVGGFAGILCLALLLVQPLLAAAYLPGPGRARERGWHRWVGIAIVICTVLHIGGLFVTSPPDTLDALLLVSPTPFSVYGVTAMWGVFATGLLVLMRRRFGLALWRVIHNSVALVVVFATVIHALQIEGAMEPVSKWALCIAVVAASLYTMVDLRLLRPLMRRRS
ncbi:ferric reductase-like transmembrane domain-containing protein [Paracoccus aestuariivivens]|uniref:ferric reductase-like transmembrane domain-containing protein n=1 Tax=Paracoccus aestuariivivens TaxID=1820333 RepID=UPI001FE8A9F7|nr:ferric reductase-like transmembrane domain-containing protein [Paracoccus aestuariivivens]